MLTWFPIFWLINVNAHIQSLLKGIAHTVDKIHTIRKRLRVSEITARRHQACSFHFLRIKSVPNCYHTAPQSCHQYQGIEEGFVKG